MYILIRQPDDEWTPFIDNNFFNHPPKAEHIILCDEKRRVHLFETASEAEKFREDVDIKCLIISWP